MIRIQKNIFKQLVEWTKAEKPNEAAGYLFNHNSLFVKIITANKSVVHFFDEDTEKLLMLIDVYGNPTVIFHSHPGSAVPSGVDYEYMITTIPFFKCVWLIMSNKMKLRAWTLDRFDAITEVEVEIIE